jgi:hypothetical protein
MTSSDFTIAKLIQGCGKIKAEKPGAGRYTARKPVVRERKKRAIRLRPQERS